MPKVSAVYFGTHDAMVAEIAAFSPRGFVTKENCRYLVMPVGDAEYDTEFCRTIAEARAMAKEIADAYSVNAIRLYA